MSTLPERIPPGPGQESVWDYPRPPRIEQVRTALRVTFGGQVIAETRRAIKYMETSHPPVYYFPPDDVHLELLSRSPKTSVCEYKGIARYYSVRVGSKTAPDAVWGYPEPKSPYLALAGFLAFYPQAMDECTVDGETVGAQGGSFYGGWITKRIVGPFKGGPGTIDW
ncbi:MAG: DUF427 domain-containing protein [Actinobacteria bacterium]|nr:MAG: DUF427 domain-containing protein [Actinomycetota bacterium]